MAFALQKPLPSNQDQIGVIMNVLIQTRDSSSDREISEFTEGRGDRAFISHSVEESIAILSREVIGRAVISMKGMRDAAILKHINEYYPEAEVVVIANRELDDLISAFRNGNYEVIHEPLRLSELKGKTETKRKSKPQKEQNRKEKQ